MVPIQRALDTLEKWADRSLVKLSRGKCEDLHLRKNNSMYHSRLLANRLGSSFAMKGCGAPLGKEVEHEAAMCPCSGEGQQCALGEHCQWVEEGG